MLRRLIDTFRFPAREEVLGLNGRDRALVQTLNRRRDRDAVDDKVITKDILASAGVPTPKTHFVIETFADVMAVDAPLRELDDFVVKPARGRGGEGILVIVGRDGDRWRGSGGRLWTTEGIQRRLGNIVFGEYAHRLSDRALIEERLLASPILCGGRPVGLADARILTLRAEPIMAMVRIPTRQSRGRANLHQGAVGVGVDLETGRTTHATYRGRAAYKHPDTSAPLLGELIPDWEMILEVAARASDAMPLGYLGIDVALTAEGGPVILEANARPGLEIQNANHRGLGRVVRDGFAPPAET